VGDRVAAGQVLGFVEPPLAASDLAQLRALDLQYQSLDLEIDLKALEVSRALNEAEARLAFATKESARIANLRAEGLSTVQQHDQAQQNLAVAKADEQSARTTRESLERLLASRASQVRDREAKTVRLPLVAPIAGVVVSAASVVGESVHPDDELFRLIDTGSVWIEGRISEFDLARVPREPTATLVVAALESRGIDVLRTGGRMLHIAPIVDASTRTLVIRYQMPNADGLLKAGMLATLLLETSKSSVVVAIPEGAVVLNQGLATVYVMLEGELFQKRELEIGIRDAGYVEVRSGLRSGERVATHGAYAVKLAALSPAAFGPGHAH
ncbi:MAG: efflux RND transporter periplasmic adaptor subunit, partial [Bryobacteraceae bacterium]